MDGQSMQYATREAVKKKFGGKQAVVSKIVPHYPQNLEREYVRLINAYLKLLNNTVAEHIPRIRDVMSMQVKSRQDAADDEPKQREPERSVVEVAVVTSSVDSIFDEIMDDFMKRQGLFGLSSRIEKLSNLNRKLTITEWKRVVKRTLGIDIMEDYYKGERFQRLFDKWVADNVGLIKTIPQDTLGKMRSIVKNGYLSGASSNTIAKQIREAYGTSKSHARFLARDQTAKLNARVTQEQQRDAGVVEYVWRTVGDSRVRERHAKLNNRRFRYDKPESVDGTVTKPFTTHYCNSGEDYRCRCVGLPVFDLDTVVLPWEMGNSVTLTVTIHTPTEETKTKHAKKCGRNRGAFFCVKM